MKAPVLPPIASCPKCGHAAGIYGNGVDNRYVVCQKPGCHHYGPTRQERLAAVLAWNEEAKS